MGMSTNVTPKPDSQVWGIYHADRECARVMGDPLRTIVEASNKIIAEEIAVQLGFGDPLAHPVSSQEIRHAQWLPKRRSGHRQELAHKPSRGIRI
jgi:hypothetical protein